MAKNQVYNVVNEFSMVVPAGTKSGEPVLGNGFFPGVAMTDEGAGGNPAGRATVHGGGKTFSVACADAIAAEGTAVYITAARVITTTAAGNTLFGHTVAVINRGVAEGATKAAGAGNVNVRTIML